MLTVLVRLARPELLVDFAVELVLIHLIQAAAEILQALFHICKPLLAFRSNPGAVGLERVNNRIGNSLWYVYASENFPQTFRDLLLPHIWKLALTTPKGAVVIDVLALLDLG